MLKLISQGVDSACILSRQVEGEPDFMDIPNSNYTYTPGSSYNPIVYSDNNSYSTEEIRISTTYNSLYLLSYFQSHLVKNISEFDRLRWDSICHPPSPVHLQERVHPLEQQLFLTVPVISP